MPPLSPEDAEAVAEVVDRLDSDPSVLFITGAGISADSGIPTYRGVGGLYNDVHTPEGIPIEVALSGEMMRARPQVTWRALMEIAKASQGATYNRGHAAIAALGRQLSRVWVLTQNVDGFHRQAGSERVIEIHGDIHDLYCTLCGWKETVEDYREITEIPPRCPDCRGVIRPSVVLFGEWLPPKAIEDMNRELARGFDIVFSVGTTSAFPYIAAPVIEAAERGDLTVEINPDATDVTEFARCKIRAGAADALDAIWCGYAGRKGLPLGEG